MPRKIKLNEGGGASIKFTESQGKEFVVHKGKKKRLVVHKGKGDSFVVNKKGGERVVVHSGGGKKIKLSEIEFSSHVKRIEKGRDDLSAVKPHIAGRESRSQAMDEFERRFREMDAFVQEYRSLLDKDVAALRKAALAMKKQDASIASSLSAR